VYFTYTMTKTTYLYKLLVTTTLLILSLCGCSVESSVKNQMEKLPAALSQAVPLSTASLGNCATGGILIMHGLDFNGDGRLGPYEQHHEEIVCNPAPLGITPATGVALKTGKSRLPDDG
jgi:hypothetical protein